MPKIYKRILTPLFFVVAALVIICCSAFASDGISGIPEISINGEPSIPLISTVTLLDGDEATITKSGIISSNFNIPTGACLTIPSYIDISITGIFNVSGVLSNYGNLVKDSSNIFSTAVIEVQNGGEVNVYYGSIISSPSGNGIINRDGGIVNIYGGNVDGGNYGILNQEGSVVNFISGLVSGGTSGFLNNDTVDFNDGVPNIDTDTGTVTVSTKPLSIISNLVSASIEWISSFISAITSNSLLLVFVLVIFTGFGISLLRRVKSI